MITVDPLVPGDRAAWVELFRGYNDFYGRTWPQLRYEAAWREFLHAERVHALGARLDGTLVGIAHFLVHASTTSPDVCYLQDLFTGPAARGRGVASALIDAVARWARARGCERLYWHTSEWNGTARRLYERIADDSRAIRYVLPLG